MENKSNLYKAILQVMKAVKNIDKSMTVGTGTNSYKGVADKDVKYQIGKAMEENGLAMIPIEVKPTLQIERWEETNQYGTKNKQQIFTEVTTKYLLIHESGESIEVVGYGHGVDTQDKAAGKATTYALKYALLYTFMVPTGEILDTDKDHSDTIETPPAKKPESKLRILKYGSKQWDQLTERIGKGETITKEELKKYFEITEVEKELETLNIF
ncbi:ERF family protein [uncultured Chryseobacterium sp.]|uniref:ERF family protein n=1 Tax=uncultured Chryseobacterium sp. TaxID=259322 RepID=UPI00258555F8|nr:ERF family protein [uncultured Chryseobacterium sp.]